MALALYRKYRPQTFAEVIGQEHVTQPLIQAIRNGRLNHAYLFSGPRGCGKTSSARILARSLNCVAGPTPEPCGECESCVALSPGGPGSIDVIEIDAASHGGVDDARELRERAVFAPVSSKYKVYVIDEAHMVSSAGFNALLKLVEEPPDYVMFVFATTEPEKVLPTIRSRTHHYPFRLMAPGPMRSLAERLCAAEGIEVESSVYPLVIRAGGGSARDTLSVLDQLIAGAGPEGVTYQRAVALLGVTDSALLDEMCGALAAMDGAGVLACVDRVVEAGHDPRRFAADLLERLRDLIVLNQIPDAAAQGIIDVPADDLERMTGQALRMGTATLTRMAEIMHDGLSAMRGTTAPRLLLELACARAILPDAENAGLLQRLESLERRIADGVPVAAPTAGEVPAEPAAEPESPQAPPRPQVAPPPADAGPAPAAPAVAPVPSPPAPTPAEPAPSPAASPAAEAASGPARSGADGSALDAAGVRRMWDQIIQATKDRKKTVAAYLLEATVTGVQDNNLVLSFKHSFHANAVQSDASMQVFTAALSQVLGGTWRVRCEVGDVAPQRSAPAPAPARPAAPAADDGWPQAAVPPNHPPAAASPPSAPPVGRQPDTGDEPPDVTEYDIADEVDDVAAGDAVAPDTVGTSEEQAIKLLSDTFGAKPIT